jgi:hypothetical protein
VLTEHSGLTPTWRKSARCGTAACVEVLTESTYVGLRNSTDPNGPALSFTPAEWREFIAGVKAGDFDLP